MKRILFRNRSIAPGFHDRSLFTRFSGYEGARLDFTVRRGNDALCCGCEMIEESPDE